MEPFGALAFERDASHRALAGTSPSELSTGTVRRCRDGRIAGPRPLPESQERSKSTWLVEKYGIRLMLELYEYLNPMPYEAAAQMEKESAEDLRAEGDTVTGGT